MYTKMTRIKTGKAGLNYILNESAHNNNEQRNEFVIQTSLTCFNVYENDENQNR